MRPNKLIMQAFGPFAQQETIEFDQLGEYPLFLINGATGSGKSSILDAICFALYGQTTSKERDAMQMRCDHAPDTLLTEITLEFTFRDKRYRVNRSPTQIRAKARGDGTTTHQTTAQFTRLSSDKDDELLISKSASEVSKEITTLIGLHVEQFRRLMVLPQGKFREFLLADSAKREAIFSQLFETDIYQKIEYRLKKRALGIKRDVEGLENQIKGLLQGADVHSEEELEASLVQLQKELKQSEAEKAQTDKAVAKQQSALDKANQLKKEFDLLDKEQQQHANLQKQSTEIDRNEEKLKLAQAADKIAASYIEKQKLEKAQLEQEKQVAQTNAQLNKQKSSVQQAQSQLAMAEKEASALDTMKAELLKLEEWLPKLSALDLAIQNRKEQEKQLAQATKLSQSAEATYKSLQQQIAQDETQQKTLQEAVSQLADNQSALDRLLELGKQKSYLDQLIQKHQGLQNEHSKSVAELKSLQLQLDQQETKTKTLKLSWYSNQAALLAAELTLDEPCPVCGSHKHPNPTSASENIDAASKADVETAESLLTNLKEKVAAVDTQIASLDKQLNDVQKEIQQREQELGEDKDKSTDQLRNEWRQLDAEVKNIKKQSQESQKLSDTIDQQKASLQQLEKELEQAKVITQQQNESYLIAETNEKNLKAELPEEYRDSSRLKAKIKALNQSINEIVTAHQKAQEAYQLAQTREAEIASALEQQEKQIATLIKECGKLNQQWSEQLALNPFLDETEFLSAQISDKDQKKIAESIQAYKDEIGTCKARIDQQKERLKDKSPPDLLNLQNKLTELHQDAENALNHWKQINSRFDKQKDTQTKLQASHESNKKLEQEYAIYGTLSDVANGRTGNKISLQRFVISVFLDDVLIEASSRLHAMSKKRYRLIRKQERAKGNKASGLELEVEDAFTGKTRSVNTLSGGESFMAALSLALGLSDRVQSYAGGIKLDTLFIDEGFGSLDQESLDSAIKTLIDLQSHGRMIGIISHVSELREQIKQRIDVIGEPSGSHVRVCA